MQGKSASLERCVALGCKWAKGLTVKSPAWIPGPYDKGFSHNQTTTFAAAALAAYIACWSSQLGTSGRGCPLFESGRVGWAKTERPCEKASSKRNPAASAARIVYSTSWRVRGAQSGGPSFGLRRGVGGGHTLSSSRSVPDRLPVAALKCSDRDIYIYIYIYMSVVC